MNEREIFRAYRVSLPESELGFQGWAVDLALLRGWLVYHTFNSKHSVKGFPDLVLVREKVLYRECKRDSEDLTAEQAEWLTRLERAGADAGVWRPRDRRSIEKELE